LAAGWFLAVEEGAFVPLSWNRDELRGSAGRTLSVAFHTASCEECKRNILITRFFIYGMLCAALPKAFDV
jgi:hypothetical protein